MRDLDDDTIDAAIVAEEAALLRAIGEEPGYLTQARSIFRGGTGWVNVVLMVAQTGLFVAGVYCGWRFFQANAPLNALRWGFPSAVLLQMSLAIKLSLWPAIHANRVLRAIKRLEIELRRN
ncbi:DUF6768 family protein [Sphingomonas sp.]|uniref:DUF6768 family protein n=1 Tax=Sphingomonas sp. TaxID=28214 RepID=UPI0025FEF11B|nr:DUF6768 family protein [Sphingomonas sp.]